MQILNTKDEVIQAISQSNLQPKNSLTSTNYGNHVTFQCSCNETHTVNDISNQVFAIAMPVKFCFICKNQHVSFVQVKGFFSQKANTIWSCKADLFNEALDQLDM